MTACILGQSIAENPIITERCFSPFAPDTISPDSIAAITDTTSIDTIAVIEIYTPEIIDTTYSDGLDNIIILLEDTTGYFMNIDSASKFFLNTDVSSDIRVLPASTSSDITFIDSTSAEIFIKPVDSIDYYFATDTSAYYIKKYDTVAYQIEKMDSNLLGIGGNFNEKDILNLSIMTNVGDIRVTPGDEPKQVNYSLFGVHIPGIFLPQTHIGEDATNYMEAWEALRDLKPASLRYPGGADTRWQHPYDYDKDWDGDIEHIVGNPDRVKGYGYDIYEIIRFFDVTENEDNPGTAEIIEGDPANNIQADDPDYLLYIIDGMDYIEATNQYNCTTCSEWMNNEQYQANFEDLYKVWVNQEEQPGDSRYIDQFIDLVTFIENYWHAAGPDHEADPDYKIDVIVDLPIPCASATECWNFVNYLRHHELNGVTDVKIVGVEMGNETYFGWAIDMMGFGQMGYVDFDYGVGGFGDYYNYINGLNPNSDWADIFFDYVYAGSHLIGDYTEEEWNAIIADKTWIDHDYIRTFRMNPEWSCKVGIPAENLPNDFDETDGNVFGLTGADPGDGGGVLDIGKSVPNWNIDLGSHYPDQFIGPHGHPTGIFKFNAVIPHTYYKPHNQWYHIAMDPLCSLYPLDPLYSLDACIAKTACDDLTVDPWQFDTYDIRLETPFQGIMGFPIQNYHDAEGNPDVYFGPAEHNMHQFFKTGYLNYYREQEHDLHFSLTGPSAKEMWATEKNFLSSDTWNEGDGATAYDKRVLDIYYNTFVQGYFDLEWFLDDLTRLNFTSPFRENFFTYSHIHSYAGGGWQDLLVQPTCDELAQRSPPIVATGTYWLKRTSYYTYLLLSDIFKQKLQYLPSTIALPKTNINHKPTVFIDPDHEFLYIYGSNIYSAEQNIILDPSILNNLFDYGCTFVNYETHLIDAQFPYSGTGKNIMFNGSTSRPALNFCYDNCPPFDIPGITGTWGPVGPVPDPFIVSFPGYSFGYIKVGIHAYGPGERQQANAYDKASFTIYPNPAYDHFNIKIEKTSGIQSDEKLNVIVSDIMGTSVAFFNISQFENADISNLPAGLYQVTVMFSDNNKITKSLIKIK